MKRYILPFLLIILFHIFSGCSSKFREWNNPYIGKITEAGDNQNGGSSSSDYYTNFWSDGKAIPAAKNVLMYKFLNRTYGAFSDDEIFWSFNGETNSIAEKDTFDMPANSSGRMYFYLGSKNSQYVDFIEFTITTTRWYGNTTRVDWFGFPIAIKLHCKDGYEEMLGETEEVFKMKREDFFQLFINETPAKFHHLVQAPYKIVAPGNGKFRDGGEYSDYFTDYVNQVWAIHSLTIGKPTTEQVFRCSGPIATEAQISAALNRHTAHLSQSEWENKSNFYSDTPANYYAEFFHKYSYQGKAYGFPYDDVGGNAAYTEHDNPEYLIIAIGY